MAPALIVKRFEVFKERTLRLVTRFESIAELDLHRREKRFHHRVVETIAAAAHAARDAMGFENRLVILTRIWTPAVGVMQEATLGAPTLQRHLQRRDRQVSIVRRADGPPHDKRENKSRMAARYSLLLSPMTNSVVSPTQRWFTVVAVNCRSSRFAATGWS